MITGSTGFEAAVMGKPVISFGRHNGYNMLPHVFHVTDLANTSEVIERIFDGGVDQAQARQAGVRYLQAVVDTSFDLGAYDYVDLKKYDTRGRQRRRAIALEAKSRCRQRRFDRVARAG